MDKITEIKDLEKEINFYESEDFSKDHDPIIPRAMLFGAYKDLADLLQKSTPKRAQSLYSKAIKMYEEIKDFKNRKDHYIQILARNYTDCKNNLITLNKDHKNTLE